MNYQVAIVGAGLIGKKRARALTSNQQLSGIFDLSVVAMEDFSKEFDSQMFESLDDMFSTLKPGSLLIVATNHQALAETAKKGLEAGFHVLIEKPGARSKFELDPLIQIARRSNLVLRVGYNHRFHPSVFALSQISKSKEFGPIQLIRARYGHGGRVGYESEWRAIKEISGGGELLDQGSHLIDLVNFLDSPIKLEYSDTPTLYWDMQVEDNAFISGRTTSGSKIWMHASWTEWKNIFSFEVFFKTAKVEISGLGGSYGPETLTVYHMVNGIGIPEVKQTIFDGNDLSWDAEMIDLDSQIMGKEFVGATGEDALQVLETIGEAYKDDSN